MNFTSEFYEVDDFGHLNEASMTWSGVIGELVKGQPQAEVLSDGAPPGQHEPERGVGGACTPHHLPSVLLLSSLLVYPVLDPLQCYCFVRVQQWTKLK